MSFDDINDANFDKVRYQALKASAGSGKTFNLAARFLALVLMVANCRDNFYQQIRCRYERKNYKFLFRSIKFA